MAEHKGDSRFFGGPRALGAVLPRLVRPALRRKGAAAPILADWPALVGPALAAVTQPRSLVGGTLTLAASGPIAMELTHLAPQLIARINGELGQVVVQRLKLVQQPVGSAPPARPAPRGEVTLPDAVATSLETVPGDELRAALSKLAQGVYRSRR